MKTTKTSILFKILFIIGLTFLLSLIGGKVEANDSNIHVTSDTLSAESTLNLRIRYIYHIIIKGKNESVTFICDRQTTGNKERTCTTDGIYKYIGHAKASDGSVHEIHLTMTWKAPGHKKGKVTEYKNPTCTDKGYKIFSCNVCKKERAVTEVIAALGHKPTKFSHTVAPTCTAKGYDVYQCSRTGCNYTTNKNYEQALGHGYSKWVRTVSPTCTEQGYQEYKCSRCPATTKIHYTPALGHACSKWVETVKPTCTERGYSVYRCIHSGCNKTANADYKPATGHNYVNGVCKKCGAKDLTYASNPGNPPKPADGSTSVHVHTWVNATCTEPKTCSGCGKTEGEPLGHSFNARGVCTKCGAKNETAVTEWELGDNVIANLAGDGTLTIKPKNETTSENKMWDWINPSNSNGTEEDEAKISPLASNKNIKKVIIKGKIANIGSYLFYYCTNINSVTIEYSEEVGRIGGGAFFGCKRLKNIDIPENIQAIGARAFCHCQELETLDLSKATKLERIGHEAFRDCWLLRNVTLPEGLLVIGYEAFLNCISLNYVVIPDTVVAIGTPGNSIQERGIGVTKDPDGAINTSGMNNVFTINFARNTGTEHLSYIKLVLARYGIIENDDEMNAETILAKLLAAKEVIEQPRVYYYSTNQVMKQYVPTRANADGGTEMVISELSWDVSKEQNKSIVAALDKNGKLTVTGTGDIIDFEQSKAPWNAIRDLLKEVEFSEGITTIGSYFNYWNRNMTKVTLPSTLKEIKYGAFFGCLALPEIEIPNSVTSIGGRAFCHCENIKTITIPASVKMLNGETFSNCYRLETVNLLGDISEIGEKGFFNCPSLKEFTVSAFVNEVGEDAFAVDFSVNADNRYKEVENVTPQPIKYYKNSKVMQDYATANADERTFTPINIDSITIKEKPTDQYYKGDELNIDGLKVAVTYHNGTTDTNKLTKEVDEFTCKPTKLETVGEQTIKVIYGGAETSFKVTVNEIEAVNIEIKTPPTKLEYYAGDTLDTTGLALTVTYANGETEDITEGYTCTPTTLTPAGNLTIEVEYKGQTTSFDVTVKEVEVASIKIKTLPTKLEYYIEDTLDTTGLVLTVTYTNGKTEDITEGYNCTPTTLTPAGNLTIEVEYEGKTTSFDVTVKEYDDNNGGNTDNNGDNDNNGGNTDNNGNNDNNGGNTDNNGNNDNNGGNTDNNEDNNNNGGNTDNNGNNNNGGNTNNNKPNNSNSSLNVNGKADGKMPQLGESVILPIAIVISVIMCIVAYKSYRKLKKM